MLNLFKSLFKSNAQRELEALQAQVDRLFFITRDVPGDTLEERVKQLLIWSEMNEVINEPFTQASQVLQKPHL